MGPDTALSDALGAVVLIAIVGMGVGLLGLAVLSTPPPEKIPSFEADLTVSDHTVLLRHEGGDSIGKDLVVFLYNGSDIGNSFRNTDGSAWTSWSIGDTLRYDAPSDEPVPDSIQIVYASGSSTRVILTLGKPLVAIRVNCGGGSYTDSRNNFWLPDQAYTPDGWGYAGTNRNTYSVANAITNTTDPELYKSESYFSPGNGAYRFTVPNGEYRVTLKFAEIYDGITPFNPRVFSVDMEGNRVITNLSLLATSGLYSATDGTYRVVVNDGSLDIDFIKGEENPKVSAIEVVSA
jgi:hypothetical protein